MPKQRDIGLEVPNKNEVAGYVGHIKQELLEVLEKNRTESINRALRVASDVRQNEQRFVDQQRMMAQAIGEIATAVCELAERVEYLELPWYLKLWYWMTSPYIAPSTQAVELGQLTADIHDAVTPDIDPVDELVQGQISTPAEAAEAIDQELRLEQLSKTFALIDSQRALEPAPIVETLTPILLPESAPRGGPLILES